MAGDQVERRRLMRRALERRLAGLQPPRPDAELRERSLRAVLARARERAAGRRSERRDDRAA